MNLHYKEHIVPKLTLLVFVFKIELHDFKRVLYLSLEKYVCVFWYKYIKI